MPTPGPGTTTSRPDQRRDVSSASTSVRDHAIAGRRWEPADKGPHGRHGTPRPAWTQPASCAITYSQTQRWPLSAVGVEFAEDAPQHIGHFAERRHPGERCLHGIQQVLRAPCGCLYVGQSCIHARLIPLGSHSLDTSDLGLLELSIDGEDVVGGAVLVDELVDPDDDLLAGVDVLGVCVGRLLDLLLHVLGLDGVDGSAHGIDPL